MFERSGGYRVTSPTQLTNHISGNYRIQQQEKQTAEVYYYPLHSVTLINIFVTI